MTLLTGRSQALPQPGQTVRRLPSVVAALLSGAVAAGLGLGILSVVVLFLWITSPYPDSGPSGALRIAADLWLLAHGADLVRLDTSTGAPSPIGLTPLMLTALPLWLLYRFGVLSLTPLESEPELESVRDPDPTPEDEPGGGDEGLSAEPAHRAIGAVATVACLVAGYVLVGLGALVHTSTGPIRSQPLAALVWLPAVAAFAAGAGAWTACGRPRWEPPARLRRAAGRLLGWLHPRTPPGGAPVSLPEDGAGVALRAAAGGTLTLVGGGALLTTGSLLWHTTQANASFTALAGAPTGRFAVLLLAGALMANAAVWAAGYALTPGFAVGIGTAVAPSGAHYAALPDFPLLAALPANGNGGPANWGALAVPVAAGAVMALTVAKGARGEGSERWSAAGVAMVAGLSALGASSGMAVLTALASGPVGAHQLSVFGPAWPATGLAALSWTFGVGAVGALTLRWWRLRASRPSRADTAAGPADGRRWLGSLRSPIPRVPVPGGVRRRFRPARSVPFRTGRRGVTRPEQAFGPWERTPAREDRWSQLKAASGGLMAPFPSLPPRGENGLAAGGPTPGVTGGPSVHSDEDGGDQQPVIP